MMRLGLYRDDRACSAESDCSNGRKCLEWNSLSGVRAECEIPCVLVNSVAECPPDRVCRTSKGLPTLCAVGSSAFPAHVLPNADATFHDRAVLAAKSVIGAALGERGLSTWLAGHAFTVLDRGTVVEVQVSPNDGSASRPTGVMIFRRADWSVKSTHRATGS
jgi:hypothetical protein